MRLFSYVVARDYGFAPNPFYSWCTLATCKPIIRSSAAVGDWIVGTGAKTKYNLAGRLLYAMKVEEALGFDDYWSDRRFFCKRPVLNRSLKELYGDNIYHWIRGRWAQADSHHSLAAGRRNLRNVERDTSVDRVLVSRKFVYFGSSAPVIPKSFRPYKPTGEDICCPGVGHRVMPDELARAFERWLDDRGAWGLQGFPLEFKKHERVEPEPLKTPHAGGRNG
jgi:hypothetical protein